MRREQFRVWISTPFGPKGLRRYGAGVQQLIETLPPALRKFTCITNQSGEVVAGERIF